MFKLSLQNFCARCFFFFAHSLENKIENLSYFPSLLKNEQENNIPESCERKRVG